MPLQCLRATRLASGNAGVNVGSGMKKPIARRMQSSTKNNISRRKGRMKNLIINNAGMQANDEVIALAIKAGAKVESQDRARIDADTVPVNFYTLRDDDLLKFHQMAVSRARDDNKKLLALIAGIRADLKSYPSRFALSNARVKELDDAISSASV